MDVINVAVAKNTTIVVGSSQISIVNKKYCLVLSLNNDLALSGNTSC